MHIKPHFNWLNIMTLWSSHNPSYVGLTGKRGKWELHVRKGEEGTALMEGGRENCTVKFHFVTFKL
jgi:hypothetical protein